MKYKQNQNHKSLPIPSVQLVGLVVAVVPQDLDVVEHALDHLLRPLELTLDLVAVVLGVLQVKGVIKYALVIATNLSILLKLK